MQQNILRDSNITKVYLQYVDNGSRKKFSVKLRFMDKNECFFCSEIPINFTKPKNKIPIEIVVYTVDGIYKTTVKLLDSTVSSKDLMFAVAVPKSWDFIQLRKSTRKNTELPVNIQFNDGFSISSTTKDLALGGVSLKSTENLLSIYRKISCILTLELPSELIINLPDSKLIAEAKFVREINNQDFYENEKIYAFKFIKLTEEQEYVLTNYLIKLD